ASLRDGGFLLLAKADAERVLVQSPLAPRPVLMTRDELVSVWDGGLILMARRAGLSDIGRRFDITWFLAAIQKYRRLLGEVLVASFFLQLLGLVSPLFFQVVIDKVFTFVFLGVMFFYSPLLSWIVLGSFPFYIAISAAATPLFRRRLDEKFRRGAENQAFLVESVTGIETLKAMAVEPQMQRRWEEQLAGYVAASFRVTNLGNTSSQAVQLVNKLMTAATLYFGALLVIEGSLSVGELVAFTMLSGRASAPVLRLAQIWQD